MSLVDTIRAGVETAFTLGSEFVTQGTYLRRLGGSTYDPATDETTPNQEAIPNVRFLKTSSDVTEREASPVDITDVKFIIPRVDMPANFKPNTNDQMQPGDGETYNVIASRFVPGDSIYIVFGRKA